MARTPSTMLPLGTPAPDFRLLDVVTGKWFSRDDIAGPKGLLLMFICRHCPFVKHLELELARIGRDYQSSGIGMAAICANDASNPKYAEDAPDLLAEQASRCAFPFPYLYDETQLTALAYHAACTPDFFLFDGQGRLAYRGQLDATRPGSPEPVTGVDLRAALDAVRDGLPPSTNQFPSLGCNIKWKPGNEPRV